MIIMTIGFSLLIAALVFIVWIYHDASIIIPVISMYALALYRILPSIHRILLNINYIIYNEKTLESVYENIDFKYLTGDEVIAGISLKMNKEEKSCLLAKAAEANQL
jgi:deoxyhypusine synthase